jgi:Amt family ammonium transporter
VGCVLITPAGGFISPGWAIALGVVGTFPSYFVILWRPRTRLDETLDVLAAHGTAGLTGILFIGFFANQSWNGVADGLFYGDAGTLGWQAIAAVVTPLYAFGATYVLLKLIGAVMPLRTTDKEQSIGMDVVQHGEEAYSSGEGAILIEPDGQTPAGVLVADPV